MPTRKQNMFNLMAAISAIAVFGFALGVMFPLLSLVMEKHGISSNTIGNMTAMQSLGIILGVFTTPLLVRWLGAKQAAILTALGTSAIVLIYPYITILYWWFVLRFLHGLLVATLFAVSEAWVVKFASGKYRTRILALYTSILAASFGGGPTLISITGIDTLLPFIISAIILAAGSLPLFRVQDANVEAQDEAPLPVLQFAKKAPLLLLGVALFAFVDAANLGLLAVYGVQRGMSEQVAALSLTAFIVGNTVLQFPVGWLADHYNKRTISYCCMGVTALASALLPLSFGSVFYWLLLPVVGAAACGIYTVALSELGERFSGHELVTGTASFATTWGVGAFVGSGLAGQAMVYYGPNGLPYMVSAIFVFTLSLLTLSLFHKPQGKA